MFIELTYKGTKFVGNVNLLQRVFIITEKNAKTGLVGWNNNGYMECDETYDEVISKIKEVTTIK